MGNFLKRIAISRECLVRTWSHEIEVPVQIRIYHSHVNARAHAHTDPNGHLTLFLYWAQLQQFQAAGPWDECFLFSKGPRVSSLLALNMLPSPLSPLFYPRYKLWLFVLKGLSSSTLNCSSGQPRLQNADGQASFMQRDECSLGMSRKPSTGPGWVCTAGVVPVLVKLVAY